MNWWILFGCKLTGWSSEVLAQCSEASRSQYISITYTYPHLGSYRILLCSKIYRITLVGLSFRFTLLHYDCNHDRKADNSGQ